MKEAIRRARLRGAKEAERMLSILEVQKRLNATRDRVDVFDALAWLDVRVVFKPLDGLLGAFVRGGRPGVMITTRRPASVQRFTAAHEMGHAVLGHELSLDTEEVLRLAAAGRAGVQVGRGLASQLQEIEADSFAGSFLLPIWLITLHARRQGWSREELRHEDVAYQLALRCGASFQATVRALERHRFLTASDQARLLGVKPKEVKARLGHQAPVADPWSDAWRLTCADADADIEVAVGDTVAVDLGHDGAEWRLLETPDAALAPVTDELLPRPTPAKAFRATGPGMAGIRFARSPSAADPGGASLAFDVTVSSRERGLSRANRVRMIGMVAGRHDAA